MATVHNITYSATNTALTITLSGLSNASARSSAAVDNSSNLYVDAMLKATISNSTITGTDNAVYIYVYSSEDNSLFSSPSSGTDAAIVTTPSNLSLLRVIDYSANPPFSNSAITVHIGSVASAFGGNLPKYWGVIVDNRTGGALHTTTAHVISYVGITYTST